MFVSFLLCCFNGHRASHRGCAPPLGPQSQLFRISVDISDIKTLVEIDRELQSRLHISRSLPCLSCTTSSIAKMSMFYFFHLGHRRPKAFAKLRRLSESQKSLTDFNIFRSSFQPPPRLPFQKRVQSYTLLFYHPNIFTSNLCYKT